MLITNYSYEIIKNFFFLRKLVLFICFWKEKKIDHTYHYINLRSWTWNWSLKYSKVSHQIVKGNDWSSEHMKVYKDILVHFVSTISTEGRIRLKFCNYIDHLEILITWGTRFFFFKRLKWIILPHQKVPLARTKVKTPKSKQYLQAQNDQK